MRKEIWSIPNVLCYIRILLLPFFAATYIQAEGTWEYYGAATILVVSGVTDFLDGFIARKYNMVTELGKIVDPIADKLTQATAALCLAIRYELMWILFLVFAIKEITTGLVSLAKYRKGYKLDGALWFGKVATTVFYVVTVALVGLPMLPIMTANLLIIIAIGFMIFAFIRYIPAILRLSK